MKTKPQFENRWRYFRYEEFECPCCHENHTDPTLIDLLDEARAIAGIPFIITSGYRCPSHNKAVNGKPRSAHLKGLAADILATSSKRRFLIVHALLKVGFKRIGIHSKFIHADISPSLPSPTLFLYSSKSSKSKRRK